MSGLLILRMILTVFAPSTHLWSPATCPVTSVHQLLDFSVCCVSSVLHWWAAPPQDPQYWLLPRSSGPHSSELRIVASQWAGRKQTDRRTDGAAQPDHTAHPLDSQQLLASCEHFLVCLKSIKLYRIELCPLCSPIWLLKCACWTW